jgi:ATP-dependent Zn protease
VCVASGAYITLRVKPQASIPSGEISPGFPCRGPGDLLADRRIAALGYTLQLPTEDRYLLTRSELLDRLAVLLGGRATEALTFGEVCTGGQNDLQRAADIARQMVKEYGMSQRLGALAFEPARRPERRQAV